MVDIKVDIKASTFEFQLLHLEIFCVNFKCKKTSCTSVKYFTDGVYDIFVADIINEIFMKNLYLFTQY